MNQPNLFEDAQSAEWDGNKVRTAHSSSVAELSRELEASKAEARREVGIARTEARSARIDPFFESTAVEAVRSFALEHREFLTEHVREVCPTPAGLTGRAWGSIMRKAHALGYVHPAGFGRANSSNRGPKVLWRSLLFRPLAEAT